MTGKTVVLLPTYNERENIARIVPQIFAKSPRIHILVIDDNSPDGTAEEVRALMQTHQNLDLLSRPEKQGLGEAYKAGMLRILVDDTFEKVITMDADGSHSAEYIPAMLRASETHEFVIGSRYTKGGGIEDWERWRYLLSRWGNLYARVITGLPVRDMTAGFTCIRVSLLRKMDFSVLEASGYAFLMELKFRAVRTLGCSFEEVPIIFNARWEGESKISHHIIREGLLAPWKLRFKKK